MALVPTTAQVLVTNCRRKVDMKVSQFWTDQDFIAELNSSLSQLDMILVSKFSDYKLKNTLVNTVGTNNWLANPSDFLKFRGLDVQFQPNSPDGYLKVNPFNFKKRNMKPYPILGNVISSPYQMMYRLQDEQVYLLPASVASQYTYRLWYTPDYVPLVNPGDTLQPYMDTQSWSEYGVLDTCAKCLVAQDLDAAGFMAQKAELKEMLVNLATPNRDAGEPAFVSDERGEWGGGSGYGWDW